MAPTQSVLILGGIGSGIARSLLTHLVPPNADPLAAHVRVVDKHLCIPSFDIFLIYVDPNAKAALKHKCVEYVQGNLLVQATQDKVFTRPDDPSKPYDIVFDFTGEEDYTSEDIVHIERTVKLAVNLGKMALEKGGVKSYVRLLGNEYQSQNSKKKPIQEDDPALAPWTKKQKWAHEAARALANLKDLNLVLVRPAILYGPYIISQITERLLIAEIYRYTKEKMEILWSNEVSINTLHSEDFNNALWDIATWMSSLGRVKADEAAKSPLSPCRPLPSWVKTYYKVEKDSNWDKNDAIDGVAPRNETVYAPVFNIVDKGDTRMDTLAETLTKVIGVEWDFVGTVISQFAKLNLSQVRDEVNEKHMESWSEMLEKSKPPITNPPVNPFLPLEFFSNESFRLDGSKIERVIGWKPKRALEFNEKDVAEMVNLFKAEPGIWPNAASKS